MARLPRLILAGLPHLISQRAQDGQLMLRDDADRQALLDLLGEAALQHRVALYAYALADTRLELVAAPEQGHCLSLMMQSVARRHAAAYNRRHGRRGGLWEGRFRSAVLDPQTWLLRAMVYVETLAIDWVSRPPQPVGDRLPPLIDPDAYWRLGNTPFEREVAYFDLRKRSLTPLEVSQIDEALRGGWVLGSPSFIAGMGAGAMRPVSPRPRGRPRKPLVTA